VQISFDAKNYSACFTQNGVDEDFFSKGIKKAEVKYLQRKVFQWQERNILILSTSAWTRLL
jgi:hypothetical protein